MNYPEALAWLYATQERGIKLGLDHVRHFLAALGWRQDGARYLHVAGTNGKGSVCAMLDAICRAAGWRTGLFTSPHLVTFRERIRIQGEMLEAGTVAAELTRIRQVCEAEGLNPTFFEIATALALVLFQREKCEVVVLETGLGGRLDATNVIVPAVSVITSIGLDHTAMLGPTLAHIAREKGGIIKPGAPVVAGEVPAAAAEILTAIAQERNAPLDFVTLPEHRRALALEGSHQQLNAAVARRALQAAGFEIPEEKIAEGLREVRWPGRFQRCGARFILDGAHNPEAARQLARTWRESFGARRTTVILGILQDKDARGICAELAPMAEAFAIVPVRSPRAMPLEALREIAAALRPSRSFPSLAGALAEIAAPDVPALVCGSLFLIGEALTLLGLAEGEPEVSAQ